MKLNIRSSIFTTALLIGAFIGTSALMVLASGSWSGPGTGCTPPDCNTAAPINVGIGAQVKNGDLGVNAFVASLKSFFAQDVTIGTTATPATIQIVDGNQTTKGSVLTNLNGDGIAGWVTPTSSGSGGGGNSVHGMIVYDTAGTYTGNIPAGVNYINVELAGGAGYKRYNSSTGMTYLGGSGGYAKGVYAVNPNDSYSITVGANGVSIGAVNGKSTTLNINGSATPLIYATGGTAAVTNANGTMGTGFGQQNFDPYLGEYYSPNAGASAGGSYTYTTPYFNSFIAISY